MLLICGLVGVVMLTISTLWLSSLGKREQRQAEAEFEATMRKDGIDPATLEGFGDDAKKT